MSGGRTTTTPFNGPFPGQPRWAGTRKVNPIWNFTEARDSEWQWHALGHMQVCTSLQTDNHASTPPLSFLQAGCTSCRPTNSVKALKAVDGSRNSRLYDTHQSKLSSTNEVYYAAPMHRVYYSEASAMPQNSTQLLKLNCINHRIHQLSSSPGKRAVKRCVFLQSLAPNHN